MNIQIEQRDTPLDRYLNIPQPGFEWRELSRRRNGSGGRVITLQLHSQTWQGIPWSHRLLLVEPPADAASSSDASSTGLLWVTGDDDSGRSVDLLEVFAELTGARAAVLYNVPNQPLYDNLYEDALIARTFVRFLETGDETWPLLFPMVRSVQSALDALEQFAASEGDPLTQFVVTGASKRGWTSWLAGASLDRVIGIAPMVYNNLSIPNQMRRQVQCFGDLSEEIGDYVAAGLPAKSETPEGQQLTSMVDPYQFRDRLKLPKLLINGTNDRYWPLDAANLYFDDLIGEKYQLMVPNAGHAIGDTDRVLSALAAFFTAVVAQQPLPELTSHFSGRNWACFLEASSNEPPHAVSAWAATSETLDFRDAEWRTFPMAERDGRYHFTASLPQTGFLALFAEAEYVRGDSTFQLSSPLAILPSDPGLRDG